MQTFEVEPRIAEEISDHIQSGGMTELSAEARDIRDQQKEVISQGLISRLLKKEVKAIPAKKISGRIRNYDENPYKILY